MNLEILGAGSCPVCGADCNVKQTKKSKAYITCEGCGCQVFARGPVSDAALRGRVKGSKPEGVAAPAVTVRRHSADGGTQETERTIFDMAADFLARGE